LTFTVAFDRNDPFKGGIIRQLRDCESRFSPLIILSQSTNNVWNIIDPDSDNMYISHDRGAAEINLFFAQDITLTRIVVSSGTRSVPRGLSFRTISPNGDSQLIGNLHISDPTPVTSFAFDFPPTTARLFRISQIAPNGSDRHCIRIRKIECFSPDSRFCNGVFDYLFRTNPLAIRQFVEITARFNQPDQLYRLDRTFNSGTEVTSFADFRPWVEIALTRGQLLVTGYVLMRRINFELRSWSLVGSNDVSLPLDEWTVLHEVQDAEPNTVNPVEFFALEASPSFSVFRLINEGPRWDGKKPLHIDGFELFGTYTET
jgi:hypothetical protein